MEIIETYEVRELMQCTKDDKWIGFHKGMLLFKSKVRGVGPEGSTTVLWHDPTGDIITSLRGWEIDNLQKRTRPSSSALVKLVQEPQLELSAEALASNNAHTQQGS